MRTEKVQFAGSRGQMLSGLLDLPDDPPLGFVVFAHCFTCGKSLSIIRSIANQLTREGLAQLRFDFTGLGQSEGEFAATSFATNVDDLRHAAGFLEDNYAAPGALFGHSLGGAAVLAAAGDLSSVKCVATIGAPADPVHVRHLVADAAFNADDTAEINIGGRPFRIGREFVDDLERHDLAARIRELNRPLLICHSPRDTIVGIENAERIYHQARHPKSFLSLGDTDHLVSGAAAGRFLGHVLAAWAGYYLGSEAKD